jgi:hypothetical protein
MVPLSAAAVIENRIAAVLVTHRGQPRRNLADRRVPIDLFEGPVLLASKR